MINADGEFEIENEKRRIKNKGSTLTKCLFIQSKYFV